VEQCKKYTTPLAEIIREEVETKATKRAARAAKKAAKDRVLAKKKLLLQKQMAAAQRETRAWIAKHRGV
jgi:hypothetical protein